MASGVVVLERVKEDDRIRKLMQTTDVYGVTVRRFACTWRNRQSLGSR